MNSTGLFIRFSTSTPRPSTQKAVEKILDGEDLYEMGVTGITCGSAMRCLPVAMYFHNDTMKLIQNTVGACIIPHNTDIAIDAAIISNLTMANLINGMTKHEAIDEAIRITSENHGRYGNKTNEPKIHQLVKRAVEAVNGQTSQEAMITIPKQVGVSWFARETIPGAFANYAVSNTPQESALLALLCGGDNQTVPEISCAFHCAEQGLDIFPVEVIQQIEERNDVDIKKMAEIMAVHSIRQI